MMISIPPKDSTSPPLKRLKRPRAAQACALCRRLVSSDQAICYELTACRRKVKCSGTQPCKYCLEVGARCEFATIDGYGRPPRTERSPTFVPIVPESADIGKSPNSHDLVDQSNITTPRESRRTSPEPQTFVDGHHLDATAGVSLLYSALTKVDKTSIVSAPLINYGDLVQAAIDDQTLRWTPNLQEINSLLERYFTFATPTYRYLHRPTLERWAVQLVSADQLPVPKQACVYLACAQALLYTSCGDRYTEGGDEEVRKSRSLYQRAKSILDTESGPASLASVQARIAMCLYLVSTFRMTECRFAFSLLATILTSLGLHRKDSPRTQLPLVELECRRRTFWCAYVLDGYLSVMLGRPRILRDEDIDQPYPRNFDDHDLMSVEPASTIPMHGNLEAFLAHADLAKLMAQNSDLLYPTQQLQQEQILERTNKMIRALEDWKQALPAFLRPREKTLTGQRTFERQNTVLKLAHAHVCILATRRYLGNTQSLPDDSLVRKECISGISIIVNASYDLLQRGALYQGFWFTQYISIVAISTLYVLLIQGSRNTGIGYKHLMNTEMQSLFEKSQHCHRRLADMAPEGSQAYRHHKLLDQLRLQCKKVLARAGHANRKHNTEKPSPARSTGPPVSQTSQKVQRSLASSSSQSTPEIQIPNQMLYLTQFESSVANTNFDTVRHNGSLPLDASDYSLNSPFTTSDDDLAFDTLLGWEWESLDTLGLPPTYALPVESFQF